MQTWMTDSGQKQWTHLYIYKMFYHRSQLSGGLIKYGCEENRKWIQVFGCQAFVQIPKQQRKTLSPVSSKFTFVGYSIEHIGLRFMDTKPLNVMLISRDTNFVELSNTKERESNPHSNVTNNMLEYELKSSCNDKQQVRSMRKSQTKAQGRWTTGVWISSRKFFWYNTAKRRSWNEHWN